MLDVWRRPWRRKPAGLKSSHVFTDTREQSLIRSWTLPSLLGLADSVQNLLYRMHVALSPPLWYMHIFITLDGVPTAGPVGLET